MTIQGRAQPLRDVDQIPPGEIRITGIDLTSVVMHPAELKKLEGLPYLRQLYLPGPIWNPGGGKEDRTGVFKTLAALTGVQRLAFGWTYDATIDFGDNDLKELSAWTGLKELRCTQCRLANVSLAPFTQLEDLDLSFNPFTDKGMEGLAELKNLRRLLLRDTLVTDEGLKSLGNLTRLEELDLSGARVTDKGVEYLRNLKSMRRLNLLGAQVSDASIDVLAGMPHLEVLNLYRTRITNAGLAKLQSLKALSDIDLRYSRVTSNGVEALRAAVPALKVRFAGAATPRAKSAGAERPADFSEPAIAAWIKALGGTTEIAGGHVTAANLSATPVSDAQLQNLAHLPHLEKLDLHVTQVGDLGLSAVRQIAGLRELNLNN
ncbi:MAG TPA: hypothetical protein VG345_15355, partial [Bryobacteraceae bacterium]|nr:hypothetical protein [Bryobacteraceae bacterium]